MANDKDDTREARLAQALRDNLKRRKDAARVRSEPPVPDDNKDGDAP